MRFANAAAVLVLLAPSVAAQAAPNLPGPPPLPIWPGAPSPPDLGPPMLHLSASATVKVQPDELVADLQGVGTASTAVAAQRHVNELMVKAKAAAAGAAGVKTSFRDYSVAFTDEKPAHWTARQTVEIRGAEGEPVLDLVGRLQGIGLAVTDLGWQVSPDRLSRVASPPPSSAKDAQDAGHRCGCRAGDGDRSHPVGRAERAAMGGAVCTRWYGGSTSNGGRYPSAECLPGEPGRDRHRDRRCRPARRSPEQANPIIATNCRGLLISAGVTFSERLKSNA